MNNYHTEPKKYLNRYTATDILVYLLGIFLLTIMLLILQQLAFAIHWLVMPLSLLAMAAYLVFSRIRPLRLQLVSLSSAKITQELKILQVSDFHSASPARARQILHIAKATDADLVCLSGDVWEKCDPCPERHLGVRLLVASLARNFPTYIVSGNHDDTIVRPGFLSKVLPKNELDFEFSAREDGDSLDEINLFGVSMENDGETVFATNSGKLNIALAHFPQIAEKLLQNNPKLDLVLAGDTHGGQVRLPFLGAVFCYGLTFFPELKSKYRYLVRGLADPCHKIRLSLRKTYSLDNRQLFYTCSGAGFSGLPLRTFCPAQVSLISIKPAKIKSDV